MTPNAISKTHSRRTHGWVQDPWLAHTQHDYARMLLARGDDLRGRELLEQALATYRELGMERYAARAQKLVDAYA